MLGCVLLIIQTTKPARLACDVNRVYYLVILKKKPYIVVPDKSLLQTLLVSFGGMDEPNKFRNKRHMLAPGTKVQRM